ncbi:MAG: thiamine diphosphokinase [Desulfobacterium sp.]|nr:thiamine diphosphokinase [Desulfobacterium sp.]
MDCIIIASGTLKRHDYFTRLIQRADMVVCADGGARHLRRMNRVPHVAIGDFDSIDTQSRLFLEKHHVPIIKHPQDKDATDTELAAQWAMDNGATKLTFLGVTGTRLDHTLANILLLKSIGRTGTKCRIVDDNNEIYLVTESIELHGNPGDFLSLIPLTETVKGVTITGVDFPLDNAEIPMGSSLGISNRFSGTKAKISIRNGIAAVTKSVD